MKNNKFWLKIKQFLRNGGQAVSDLIFPPKMKCIFCGQDIPDFENKPYCEECESAQIVNNSPSRCKICDVPLHGEGKVCDFCKQHRPLYQKAFCPMIYKGQVRSAILNFKDDNAKYLAKPFAKLMFDRIKSEDLTIDYIVPVPSHIKTVKRRGYNQAELLANELSILLQKPTLCDLVLKTGQTKAQKLLDYAQRQTNLFKTFKGQNLARIKGKNVLIVDDILTTGATVNAVARVIKGHANNIYCLCLARRDIVDSKTKSANSKKPKIYEKIIKTH